MVRAGRALTQVAVIGGENGRPSRTRAAACPPPSAIASKAESTAHCHCSMCRRSTGAVVVTGYRPGDTLPLRPRQAGVCIVADGPAALLRALQRTQLVVTDTRLSRRDRRHSPSISSDILRPPCRRRLPCDRRTRGSAVPGAIRALGRIGTRRATGRSSDSNVASSVRADPNCAAAVPAPSEGRRRADRCRPDRRR